MGSSDDGTLVDKEEFGEIEEALPAEFLAECSTDELRELLERIHREKEAFEVAMQLDSEGIFPDDGGGEPPAPQVDGELPSDDEIYEGEGPGEWMPDDEE